SGTKPSDDTDNNLSTSRNFQNHSPNIEHSTNTNNNNNSDQVSNHSALHDSSVIYFTDNGIRKRAHAYSPPTTTTSSSSSSTLSPSTTKQNCLNQYSGKLLQHTTACMKPISGDSFNFTQQSNHHDNLQTTSHLTTTEKNTTDISNTTQKQSQFRMYQTPLVVSNVILEDTQDQLTPLPTYYKESRIDLTQNMKRGSVPDVTKQTSTLSPNDLLKLEEEHKRKYEHILDRKRQGEIIIQFVDFF
ncbi:unnamed protein product, partial [Schistosoma turkestanicum]